MNSSLDLGLKEDVCLRLSCLLNFGRSSLVPASHRGSLNSDLDLDDVNDPFLRVDGFL